MTKHIYKNSWKKGDLKVIDCDTCGYKHLHPLPTEEDLNLLYKKKFGKEIRSDFSKRKKEDTDYWKMAFQRRLHTYEELFPKKFNKPPRILDIGCGVGNLLSFYREQGWDVFGIEPSESFIIELEKQSLPHIPKMINDIDDDEWKEIGAFDVINMSMFLEHILFPQEVISKLSKLLCKNGILSIESPNDFNPLQMAEAQLEQRELWWITPLHLNYFDFSSLKSLTRKAGLTPCSVNAQFPLEMFLLFGEQYIGDSQLGRSIHLKRVSFEKKMHDSGNSQLLNELYKNMGQIGIGRTAIVHSMRQK